MKALQEAASTPAVATISTIALTQLMIAFERAYPSASPEERAANAYVAGMVYKSKAAPKDAA